MGATSTQETTITRDDLAAKLRELEGDARGQVESARSTLVAAGAVVGALVLVMVFALGRRAGKKRSTIVEIRRV